MKKMKAYQKVHFIRLEMPHKTLNEFQDKFNMNEYFNDKVRPTLISEVNLMEHNPPPHPRETLKLESPSSTGNSSSSS